jgi:Zn-finger nucleic acid-binding protein
VKITNCPQCGGQVEFKSAASVMAVCTYCRSTVLRDGATVENIGKLSEILDDFSPIQLGTGGKWNAKPFNVIGRLRKKYEDGAWNEWCVEFADGTTGWLADASGQYVMTRRTPSRPPVAMDQMQVGRAINVSGQRYVVTDARTCVCIGGEGELPEAANDNKEFLSVDLRAVGGNGFITFDYSDEPPSVYAGEACARTDLALTNLRPDDVIDIATGKLKGGVIPFDCPNCGASLEYHAGFGETIACPTCKAVVALEGERQTVLTKQNELAQRQPSLPLGAKGAIKGANYEIIGFMARSDNEGSHWEEYLLFSMGAGFLWLTHADGVWYLGEVLNSLPDDRGDEVHFAGKLYRKLYDYTASTTYVLGEFNWRVKIGDAVGVTEWGAGASSLARETYQNEVTWTSSEKIAQAEVAKIFAVSLPEQASKWSTVASGGAIDSVIGGGNGIPTNWVIGACVIAYFIYDVIDGASFMALLVAVGALWAPWFFFRERSS